MLSARNGAGRFRRWRIVRITEAVPFKIGWVVAALVGYGLVRWRLTHVTHAFRVRAGCDADRWAADCRVPQTRRQALHNLADRSF